MLTEADRREALALRRHLADALMDIAALRGMIAFKAFNPDQPRDEQGRWAPTGRSEDPIALAPRVRLAQSETCQQMMSRLCRGSIKSEFPSQYLNVSIDKLRQDRDAGISDARTAWKLLHRKDYRK